MSWNQIPDSLWRASRIPHGLSSGHETKPRSEHGGCIRVDGLWMRRHVREPPCGPWSIQKSYTMYVRGCLQSLTTDALYQIFLLILSYAK
jgi:hypothetical protein